MWAFHLKHKVDPETNEEMEVSADKCNSLLIVKPDPFPMAFEPRSAARKAEVMEQWRSAERKDAEERAAFLQAAEAKEALREEICEALSDPTSEIPYGVPATIKGDGHLTVMEVSEGYENSARPE
jgi:hypothetical protein